MTVNTYPDSHWLNAVAELPPIVVLACADFGVPSDQALGIYCLQDGSISIGNRREFGRPPINPAANTLSAVVRIAIRRGVSDWPWDRLVEAPSDYPEEFGFMAFCNRSRMPTLLDADAREELVDAVITFMAQKTLEELIPFQDEECPGDLLDSGSAGMLKAREVTSSFIESCRATLKRLILEDLEYLTNTAREWCRDQRINAGEGLP